MVSWNFGFVFTNLLLEALGSFSQACRSASLGSFSQNAVSTRHSLLAHSLVATTSLRPTSSLRFRPSLENARPSEDAPLNTLICSKSQEKNALRR
jgi:hypothetical protein